MNTGEDNRRNRLLVLAAAVVAFILAVLSWVVIVNHLGLPATPLATATAVASQPAPDPPTIAAPDQSPNPSAETREAPDTSHAAGTYSRIDIPWSVVGTGWSVATRTAAPTSGTMTLLLVSPWGASYTIGNIATSDILDVSRDGRRVMLGTSSSVWIVDVTSGVALHTWTFATKDPYLVNGRFVGTDGSSFVLLMAFASRATYALDWYTYGSVSLSWSTDVHNVRVSPNGRYLVGDRHTASDSIVILDSAKGNAVATVPTPTGEDNCATSNWWSDDEIVFSCPTTGSTEQNVWRYSLPAKATTRIARSTNNSYNGVYPTSIGTVVAHGSACSTQPLGILSSDGTADTPLLEQPHPGGSGSLFDVVGTTAYLVYDSMCGSAGPTNRSSFVAYDMAAHTTVTLVASDVAGSGVESAIVLH